jgi:hypothetical protein
MGRILYLDCFSGAAGDMLLGGLIDAGLPVDALRQALGTLGVGHELRVTRVLRSGISATRVEVVAAGEAAPGHRHEPEAPAPAAREPQTAHSHEHVPPHSHDPSPKSDHARTTNTPVAIPGHGDGHTHEPGHGHSHGEDQPHVHSHGAHGHHSLAEIAHRVGHSSLAEAGKARAIQLFRRIGEAEAAIHQMPIDEIHLHEVGAVDSIIDIVGFVFALDWFGIDDVVASPLNVGSGTVEIAHGTYPVPAPATLKLLTGVPVYSRGPAVELVTPTGALLVSDYAKEYGPVPAMTVHRAGYGAGTRDFPGTPNVLRVLIGERAATAGTSRPGEDVLEIVCAVDDMNPQLFAPAMEQLFEAGALDVFLTPIYMKKGRPGTLVTVIASDARREEVVAILFRETTTIGMRINAVARETLERTLVEVATAGGPIRIKVATRGNAVVNAAPEFEDCLRVARATGAPLKDVQAEAVAAWRAHRHAPRR